MHTLTVNFECESREEAERRVEVDGNGEVTDSGDYKREITLQNEPQYEAFLSMVEGDDGGSIAAMRIG